MDRIEGAKRLRREMTDAEQLLWRHLRSQRLQGEKFRRQEPVGKYVVDFIHYGARLIVEADGGQHSENSRDARRDAWLHEQGFKVLRFWNNEILSNTSAVLEAIVAELSSTIPLSPGPSPAVRGRTNVAGAGCAGATARGEGSKKRHRPIRSFVRREGRMTEAQRRALAELGPRYVVPSTAAPLDPAAIFARPAPVILEIGFGNGEALLALAQAQPERNFLGVEVHRPGVGSLLLRLAAAGVENVRVIVADATEVLMRLPPASLAGVHLFFPDPWPKKRHHKRRLLQPAFAACVCARLVPAGYLHCATDWDDYAAQMLAVLEATAGLVNAAGRGRYAERPASRPLTRFARRGDAAGRPARDLIFRRA